MSGEYRVTVNGMPDMTDRPSYAAGETVRILVPPAMDVNIHVTCDGAEVPCAGMAEGMLSYEFGMPAHDADVRVEMINSMNRPRRNAFGSLFKKRKGDAAERGGRKNAGYRVTLNGRPAPTGKPSYAEGETVRLRIPLARDARTEVTCGDVPLRLAESDGWEAVYEFEMPARDADVRVSVTCDMTAMPVPGPVTAEPSADGPDGEGTACPECGMRFGGQPPKFCPGCGRKLD